MDALFFLSQPNFFLQYGADHIGHSGYLDSQNKFMSEILKALVAFISKCLSIPIAK